MVDDVIKWGLIINIKFVPVLLLSKKTVLSNVGVFVKNQTLKSVLRHNRNLTAQIQK